MAWLTADQPSVAVSPVMMWLDALLLYEASFEGHEKDVRLLLKKGAKVNARLGPYGNALQAASFQGHEEVVKLLLDKGAKINAQCGHFGNALQAASFHGHEFVVKLLLNKGADVNAQGGHYGNALQAAHFKAHEKVIELLLKKGTDVNARGLQATSSPKAQEMVTPLLPSQDVDANAQNEQHENTLLAGSHIGHRRASLQVVAESHPLLNETTHVLNPRPTLDDSSESGYEIMSDEDEDLTTGDVESPGYDSPLASLRDRISDPVEYFDRLRILAHLTYEHSTLQIYNKSH